jgi:hypothetical protein
VRAGEGEGADARDDQRDDAEDDRCPAGHRTDELQHHDPAREDHDQRRVHLRAHALAEVALMRGEPRPEDEDRDEEADGNADGEHAEGDERTGGDAGDGRAARKPRPQRLTERGVRRVEAAHAGRVRRLAMPPSG